jgi:hypothetical protein
VRFCGAASKPGDEVERDDPELGGGDHSRGPMGVNGRCDKRGGGERERDDRLRVR